MPIAVSCPGCSARMSVKDEYAGKRAKCPKCGGVLVIPAAEPEPRVVEDDEDDDRPKPKAKPRVVEDDEDDERPKKKAKRRPADDDEGDDERPKKGKKKGKTPAKKGSPLLLILAAAGGLVVIGGVVAAVVLMTQPSQAQGTTPQPTTAGGTRSVVVTPVPIIPTDDLVEADRFNRLKGKQVALETQFLAAPNGSDGPIEVRGGLDRVATVTLAPGTKLPPGTLPFGQRIDVTGTLGGDGKAATLTNASVYVVRTDDPTPVELTATQLRAEFKANPQATVTRYRNKVVKISGVISTTVDDRVLSLTAGTTGPQDVVKCHLRESQVGKVPTAKGDQVTLLGFGMLTANRTELVFVACGPAK